MRLETVTALRFGLGLPLPAGSAVGGAAMLAALAAPGTGTDDPAMPPIAEVMTRIHDFETALRARRQARRASGERRAAPEIEAAHEAAQVAINTATLARSRAMLARALGAPDGFRERLALFWADHFAVAAREAAHRELPGALVEQAIRPHLTGRFADLLMAVETHPAMLIYLDQSASFGPTSAIGLRRGRGLNENLARELLELHTLGVGAGYGQDDVRELAELLTGLALRKREGFHFQSRRAEPGAETVLGVVYPEDPADGMAPIRAVLSDLARRPETARHVSAKIAVHFVADDPDPGLIAAMEGAWLATDGDLMAVYAALLAHPAAWAAPGAKVRRPVEFVLASLRALGLGTADVLALEARHFNRLILQPMAGMGQAWQAPGGPDGWPEAAEAWISPQGLGARIRWAMEAPARLVPALPDPRALVAIALGDVAGARLVRAVGGAESRAEGVGLVLASPEFNRR